MARFQASMKYIQGGLDAYNIVYLDWADPGGGGPFDVPGGVAERLVDSFKNSLRGLMTAECALVEVSLKSTEGAPDDTVLPVVAADGQGTASGAAASINNAMLLRKVFAGTRRPGYMYLPGLPESQVDQGATITPGWAQLMSTEGGNFLANLKVDTALAPGLECTLTGPGVSFGFEVTSLTGSNKVSVQKRRRS